MVKIMLKEIRTKRKITLRQLEAASGISISTLSRIEKGQVSPTLFELDRIAVALDVSLWDLVKFIKK
ncbi:MAG: helix-turn-helix transcriptional regulator [Candidatus Metalachnospira sp.]|nr:helix-turn-helix transcriptional regulator [Candidatus Metalachnospira sp.]